MNPRPPNGPRSVSGSHRLRSGKIADLVRADLRLRLRAGEWQAGAALPGEHDLAAEYDVARGTIREALQELARQGLVVTRHGAGTFVTAFGHLLQTNLAELTSMTQTIKSAGMDAGMTYTLRAKAPASAAIRNLLALTDSDSTEVFSLNRQVEANGLMVAVSFDSLRADIFPADFEPERITGSLFSLCAEFGHPIRYATAELHAAVGSDLGLTREAAAESFIGLHQVHFDGANLAVLYARTYLRDGYFNFSLLRRKAENAEDDK